MMTKEDRKRITDLVSQALAEDRETIAEVIRHYGTSGSFIRGMALNMALVRSIGSERSGDNRCRISG